MPDKRVTFPHVCMDCSQFLHVICGVTTDDNKLLCHQCSFGKQAGPIPFKPTHDVAEQTGDSSKFQNIPNNQKNNLQNTSGPSHSTRNTSVRRQSSSAAPKTTSCKKQKTQGGDVNFGVGKHVKIERSNLYHIVKTTEQHQCLPYGVSSDYVILVLLLLVVTLKLPRRGGISCLMSFQPMTI